MKQNNTKIGSILTRLFRTITHNLEADNPARQEKLIEYFLRDPRNHVPQNVEDRAAARGNLRKDLVSSSITMKTFVKLMTYLRIYSFKIIIETTHANGKVVQHTIGVDVSGGMNDEEPIEDSNK